ncbi:MAG: hypothetical protein RMM53_09970, partial [Bacteroidia bacterium]|nr:hypothetical protein [Bacteroidia bacterium]
GGVFDVAQNAGAFGVPGEFFVPVYVLEIEGRRYIVEFGLEYSPELLESCQKIIRSMEAAP